MEGEDINNVVKLVNQTPFVTTIAINIMMRIKAITRTSAEEIPDYIFR